MGSRFVLDNGYLNYWLGIRQIGLLIKQSVKNTDRMTENFLFIR